MRQDDLQPSEYSNSREIAVARFIAVLILIFNNVRAEGSLDFG